MTKSEYSKSFQFIRDQLECFACIATTKHVNYIGHKIQCILFLNCSSIAGRVYSSIREFALKYDLGKPVAGNFCLIDYEKEPFDINYAKLDQPFPLYVRRAIEESDLSQPPS